MKTFEIGKELEITSYETEQKGYGGQGLYVNLFNKETLEHYDDIYVQDIFPNIVEHFTNYVLDEKVSWDEETDEYEDEHGNKYEEYYVCSNKIEMLNKALEGRKINL